MDLKLSTDGEKWLTINCEEQEEIESYERVTYLGMENGYHLFSSVFGIYEFKTDEDVKFEVGKMYDFKNQEPPYTPHTKTT